MLGIEPRTYGLKDRCLKNVTPTNKGLTQNSNPVFDTSLAILLQKYPDLQEIISAWPNLPEHIKAAVKALIQTEKR